jgi:hypothetical protein
MIDNMNKIILTDCDGVLMNWEFAFNLWMKHKGYNISPENEHAYDMGQRYGLDSQTKKLVVQTFNESAAIGFLPPLRDAMYYVDLLHRKHGYVFHMVTSLSLDPSAQALRIENTKKLFGETAFTSFSFADTGADKVDVLEPYKGSGYLWLEDKTENAELGDRLGLESILIEHGHNMNNKQFPLMKNWSDLYEYITG